VPFGALITGDRMMNYYLIDIAGDYAQYPELEILDSELEMKLAKDKPFQWMIDCYYTNDASEDGELALAIRTRADEVLRKLTLKRKSHHWLLKQDWFGSEIEL